MTNTDIPARMTDDALKATQEKGGGWGRAAGYLLQLPVDQRANAESEGTIRSNMNGGRYADAIGQVVRRFLAGDTSTPYIEMNSRIIAKERTQSWH